MKNREGNKILRDVFVSGKVIVATCADTPQTKFSNRKLCLAPLKRGNPVLYAGICFYLQNDATVTIAIF